MNEILRRRRGMMGAKSGPKTLVLFNKGYTTPAQFVNGGLSVTDNGTGIYTFEINNSDNLYATVTSAGGAKSLYGKSFGLSIASASVPFVVKKVRFYIVASSITHNNSYVQMLLAEKFVTKGSNLNNAIGRTTSYGTYTLTGVSKNTSGEKIVEVSASETVPPNYVVFMVGAYGPTATTSVEISKIELEG